MQGTHALDTSAQGDLSTTNTHGTHLYSGTCTVGPLYTRNTLIGLQSLKDYTTK